MRVRLAHLRDQGIDFAVFDADATSKSQTARRQLLARLWHIAECQGLKVDKAALCYSIGRRIEFFGTPDLVRYLQRGGVPTWTHWIDLWARASSADARPGLACDPCASKSVTETQGFRNRNGGRLRGVEKPV